jgi:hypothetical protein
MKIVGFLLFFLLVFSFVRAADFPEPLEIIQKEGKFVFTDGSSYYLFKKDYTFESGPLGMSGREISGTWKAEDGFFVVNGKWGWLNGGSQSDDYRKMVLYVARPDSVEKEDKSTFASGILGMKVYKCYFEIEELRKISKP